MMRRAIALPQAAIMLIMILLVTLNAPVAASDQDAPPLDPTHTGAAPLRSDDPPPSDDAPQRPDDAPQRPDDAPQRPDDAPPSDAVAGADAAAVRVYLPLVVRPNPLFDLYPPVNRAWEEEFIRLLNEERARHGLHPLREHPLLTLAARRHAYDVGINQMSKGPEHCSHTGTDGTTPGQRAAWAGYPGRFWGEAVSCGKHEVYYAVQGLLNSPPHRAFLLDPDLVEVGVGVHPIITDVEWRRGSHSTVMLGGMPRP
jgi:uncharacterized protein YkwD